MSVLWGRHTVANVEIRVGEEVLFRWSDGHDVYRFRSEAAFDHCDFSNAELMVRALHRRRCKNIPHTPTHTGFSKLLFI